MQRVAGSHLGTKPDIDEIPHFRQRCREALLKNLLFDQISSVDEQPTKRRRGARSIACKFDSGSAAQHSSKMDGEDKCQTLLKLCSKLKIAASAGRVHDVLEIFGELEGWPMTLHMLRVSSIGREVNRSCLRKSTHQEVARRSHALVSRWRRLCCLGKRQYADVCAEHLEANLWDNLWDTAFVGSKKHLIAAELRGGRRDYLLKVRSFTQLLRRSADLRRQLLDGTLRVEEFVRMSPDAFLSQEQKDIREKERLECLRASVIVGSMFTCFSERLECPNCGTRGARYSTPGSEE